MWTSICSSSDNVGCLLDKKTPPEASSPTRRPKPGPSSSPPALTSPCVPPFATPHSAPPLTVVDLLRGCANAGSRARPCAAHASGLASYGPAGRECTLHLRRALRAPPAPVPRGHMVALARADDGDIVLRPPSGRANSQEDKEGSMRARGTRVACETESTQDFISSVCACSW